MTAPKRKGREQNPWTTLKVREVFSNPWISLSDREVLLPSGRPGEYGVVHFKNVAVGVLALDEKERVLLVGQWRYPLNAYSWEIPEGGAPEGTDPKRTAHRELKEETGFRARKLQHLLTLHLSNSSTDERAELYLARDLVAGKAEPEETEQLQTKWVSFDLALEMALDGRITDAMSVAALMRYALLRSEKLKTRRPRAANGPKVSAKRKP